MLRHLEVAALGRPTEMAKSPPPSRLDTRSSAYGFRLQWRRTDHGAMLSKLAAPSLAVRPGHGYHERPGQGPLLMRASLLYGRGSKSSSWQKRGRALLLRNLCGRCARHFRALAAG